MFRIWTKLWLPSAIVLITLQVSLIFYSKSTHKIYLQHHDKLTIENTILKLHLIADEIKDWVVLKNLSTTQKVLDSLAAQQDIHSIHLIEENEEDLAHVGAKSIIRQSDHTRMDSATTYFKRGDMLIASKRFYGSDNNIRTLVVERRMHSSTITPIASVLRSNLILLIGFIIAVFVGNIFLKTTSNDIEHVIREAREIAQGRIKNNGSDKNRNGQSLSRALSEMKSALKTRLFDLTANIKKVTDASVEIIDKTILNREYSTRVVGSAQEMAKLVDNFNAIIEDVEKDVSKVFEQTEEGVQRILSLGTKAQQIGSVTTTIKEIAKRINLISLNASIEAVHAGDSGHGFAVVAAEVRKLAESTKQAIQNISELVEDIQSSANSTLLITEHTENSVKKIVDAVQQECSANQHLKSTVEEINTEIHQSLNIVDQIVQSAERLHHNASLLQSQVATYEI